MCLSVEGKKYSENTHLVAVIRNKSFLKECLNEIELILKLINGIKSSTGEVDWVPEVQKLKKGQCVVVGDKMKPNGIVEPAAPVVTSVASFDEREVNF